MLSRVWLDFILGVLESPQVRTGATSERGRTRQCSLPNGGSRVRTEPVTLLGMSTQEPSRLSEKEVRKVAQLARLELTDEAIELYAGQLSSILEHIAILESLDVEGVEPMAHPLPLTNRLAEDVPGDALPVEVLLENAPARESVYISVPKVLGGES